MTLTAILSPAAAAVSTRGGLARRATLIARLVKENPNSFIVESGNIASNELNVGIVSELLASIGYTAVGVGKYDIPHLSEYLKQASNYKLTVVDALLPKSDNVLPFLVKNVGGVKVGVVSFGGDCSANGKISVDAQNAFNAALKAARNASDVLIMLDQGQICRPDWLSGDAALYGTPDIIIGGAAFSNLLPDAVMGTTHIVQTSLGKGRKIGLIDIEVLPDHTMRMNVQLIVISGNPFPEICVLGGIGKRVSRYNKWSERWQWFRALCSPLSAIFEGCGIDAQKN